MVSSWSSKPVGYPKEYCLSLIHIFRIFGNFVPTSHVKRYIQGSYRGERRWFARQRDRLSYREEKQVHQERERNVLHGSIAMDGHGRSLLADLAAASLDRCTPGFALQPFLDGASGGLGGPASFGQDGTLSIIS